MQENKESIFNLTAQYLKKYSTTVRQLVYRSCIKWTGKKSYWLEEDEEVGDGRAEGSPAIGDGGQATVSLMSDDEGMQVHVFESLQLEGSYVGDLLYITLPDL